MTMSGLRESASRRKKEARLTQIVSRLGFKLFEPAAWSLREPEVEAQHGGHLNLCVNLTDFESNKLLSTCRTEAQQIY